MSRQNIIFEFTQRFIDKAVGGEKPPQLLPMDFAFHGDLPELRRFRNPEEAEVLVGNDMTQCVDRQDYKRSEVAMLISKEMIEDYLPLPAGLRPV